MTLFLLCLLLSSFCFLPRLMASSDNKDPFWGNDDFIPGKALDPHGLHHEDPERFISHLEDYLTFTETQKGEIQMLSICATLGILLLFLYLAIAAGLASAAIRMNKKMEKRHKEAQEGVLDLEDYVLVVKKHGFKGIRGFLAENE